LTQAAEFAKTMVPMFRQIARCVNSAHFQVGERALFLWNNDYIVSLVAQNRHVILPVVFRALERNARTHWNAAVHGLTCNVRKMFMEMDQALFDECLRQFDEEERRNAVAVEQRENQWKRLEAIASTNAKKRGIPVPAGITA